MIEDLQKHFSHILFFEDGHRYYDTKNNKELVSVTTEKKNYLHPFNKDLVHICARKKGVTSEELQEEWNELGRIGRERGTILHNYCQYLAYNKIISINKSEFSHMENLVNQIHEFFNDYKHWITLAVECIIGDEFNAGQFDRLVKDTKENKIYIVDYKFQKTFKGNYGKYMKEPYSQYPQDTLHEYGWQMSKYKSILKNKAGINIDGLKLVHFNYEDTKYNIYDAPEIEIK